MEADVYNNGARTRIGASTVFVVLFIISISAYFAYSLFNDDVIIKSGSQIIRKYHSEPTFLDRILLSISAFFSVLFLSALGYVCGKVLRDFAVPDAVLVGGGFTGLLKNKLFWLMGPQLIGIGIGLFFALSFVHFTVKDTIRGEHTPEYTKYQDEKNKK